MSLLLLLVTLFVPATTQIERTGTWYKKITAGNDNIYDNFNEFFHQCSLNQGCNFVLRDLKTNVFTGVYDEQDFPTDQKGYAIWKKMRKGKYV